MQLKVSSDNLVDAATEKIKFVHNFPSFLFSDARYELNGIEIDRIKNVGITSTMKLTASSCESNTFGYNQFCNSMHKKDAQSSKEYVYDVLITLSIWFGFCDDYRKVIFNGRHELILNRSQNNNNCLTTVKDKTNTTVVNIKVNKIEWKMPHITLADDVKTDMCNFITRNKQIPIQHRSWDLYEYPVLPETTNHIWSVKTVSHLHKPRYVLVAFRNDVKTRKPEDSSIFDISEMHINSVRLHLNSNVYPYHMHEFDIPNGRYSELYQAYANIQKSYYNGTEGKNLFTLDFGEFQTDTIFAFDTSHADECIAHGAIDIRLEIKSSKNIPDKTTAVLVFTVGWSCF